MCSWLQLFRLFNQGSSQQHISLITDSDMNDFAFIVQFKHKHYISSWLYLICFSFLLQLAMFHVRVLQGNLLFST